MAALPDIRLPLMVTGGRTRQLVRAVLSGLFLDALYQLLGLTGVALLLACATSQVRQWLANHPIEMHLSSTSLERAHLSEWVVRVGMRSPGGRCWLWVFKDELSEAQWCELRRFVYLYTPRQPVGLSMSR